MSYILDALRKSDQQRRIGATPTLQAAPLPAASSSRFVPAASGGWLAVAAGALVAGGVLIGWLQPWQAHPGEKAPVPALPPRAAPPAPVAEKIPARPAATEAPPPGVSPAGNAGEIAAPASAKTARERGDEAEPVGLEALPAALRDEMPGLAIAFHLYSAAPAERRVMINGELLREGATLPPGLVVERITPAGVVLEFRGYRFRHALR